MDRLKRSGTAVYLHAQRQHGRLEGIKELAREYLRHQPAGTVLRLTAHGDEVTFHVDVPVKLECVVYEPKGLEFSFK